MGAKLAFIAGKSFGYEEIKFYAMNGGVVIIDQTDGDFKVVNRKEWLHRCQAIGAEAALLKNCIKRSDYERRVKLLRLYADMMYAATEAGNQGDHDDPVVSAWFRRHRPWSRGTVSMVGSSMNFATGAPAPLTRRGVMHTSRQQQPQPTKRSRLVMID